MSTANENSITPTYTFRQLDNLEEVKRWTEFCAQCFAYKANPPPASYFMRHYENDPNAEPEHVFVAEVEESGMIVASVRIFLRDLASFGTDLSAAVRAGGIGEVCTDPDHRRKGLSNTLLRRAIGYMQSIGLEVSLLHASETFRKVYQKVGYVSCRSRWVDVDFCASLSSVKCKMSSEYSIRKIDFDGDVDTLSQLYNDYSVNRSKCAGCIVRSKEYWDRYVSQEMILASGCTLPLVLVDRDNAPIAWLSLRVLNAEKLIVKDFGFRQNLLDPSINVTLTLASLISEAITQYVGKNQQLSTPVKDRVAISIPFLVWEEMKLFTSSKVAGKSEDDIYGFNFTTVCQNNDDGWMYKVLNPAGEQFVKSLLEGCNTKDNSNSDHQHILWPTDSF